MTTTTQDLKAEIITRWPSMASIAGDRVERAARIADTPKSITPAPGQGDDVYFVHSERNWANVYRVSVSEKSCSCPDSQRGNTCKHRLAVWIHRERIARLVDQIKETHETVKADRAARFETFMSSHPEAENITPKDMDYYPRLGVVRYTHPQQGLMQIPVLATEEFGRSFIQVKALRLSPFSEGLFQTPYHSTLAFLFTETE